MSRTRLTEFNQCCALILMPINIWRFLSLSQRKIYCIVNSSFSYNANQSPTQFEACSLNFNIKSECVGLWFALNALRKYCFFSSYLWKLSTYLYTVWFIFVSQVSELNNNLRHSVFDLVRALNYLLINSKSSVCAETH